MPEAPSRTRWNRRSGRSSSWCRPDKRLAIYIRDGFTCAYCGRDLRDAEPAEIALDHLIPQSRHGSNDEHNLVTACRACNSGRQDKPWRQYATPGAVARILRRRRRKLNRELARAILRGDANLSDR